MENNAITIEVSINAPITKVWKYWTEPEHIKNWAFAADTWHAPQAQNDLRVGGKFSTTMAAKDGSMSFDFWGIYTEVIENEVIAYEMGDGRKVKITFSEQGGVTHIVETFDPENENPLEMQRDGWQAILNNFKAHAER
ncbi:MAG: polyketide cyclase [Flavobacterium sp.]|nr:MAG: polyketide cyclase [Flavobacterium sp.]